MEGSRLRSIYDGLKRHLHRIWRHGSHRFLPGRCLLCQAPSGRTLDLCGACAADLPWIDTGCTVCGLPLPVAGVCGQCQRDPPAFGHCRAPFAYREPIAGMIQRFKHRQGFVQGQVLGALLAGHLQNTLAPGNRPDLIVPVPAHWRRRWVRGFSQTGLLATQLSRHLGIPTRRDLLRATRHHPPQQSLSKEERRHNLRDSFAITAPVYGLHIALLDDVVTTGATANEAASLLITQGALEVEVWCIARTPQKSTATAGNIPAQHR